MIDQPKPIIIIEAPELSISKLEQFIQDRDFPYKIMKHHKDNVIIPCIITGLGRSQTLNNLLDMVNEIDPHFNTNATVYLINERREVFSIENQDKVFIGNCKHVTNPNAHDDSYYCPITKHYWRLA